MKKLALAPALCAALILSCASGKSPFSNPEDAKIVPEKSLRSLDAANDSVKVNTALQCTVQVYLPNLIDSFYVHSGTGGADSIIAADAVTGVSFSFSFSEKTAGDYSLVVVIVKADKTLDTLTRTVTVYSTAPVVKPDSAAIHVFLPADSVVITFTVTDPDSNLWKVDTWLDTATAATQDTQFLPKTHRAVISRTIRKPALLAALKTPSVCYAAAVDFDLNVSNTAACTLYVKDTVVPQIRLLAPTDTVNPIPSPVTVKALVTSAVVIDSVLFNNQRMVFNPDTALFVASMPDSGLHADSIIAIDKAGKRSKLTFSLYIQGKHNVPPQIKDTTLTRATSEGLPFAPIWLDTCVILADTSIHDKTGYAKDSLTWVITDSAGNPLTVPPVTHILTIPPTDSAFWGTFKLTFKLLNKTLSTLYDTKQPSFFVTKTNFPPVITLAPHHCFRTFKADTIYLDTITTAHDPNDPLSSLSWTFTKGSHFKVDSLYSGFLIGKLPKASANSAINPIGGIISRFYFNRHIVIDTIAAADTSYFGIDTLTFTVTDPGGLSASKKILFNHYGGLFCIF